MFPNQFLTNDDLEKTIVEVIYPMWVFLSRRMPRVSNSLKEDFLSER